MESLYLDRTDDVIKQEMLEETDDKVLKMAGTFINDSYGPSSIKLAETYIELHYLNKKRYIENLSDEELDMYVEQKAGKQVVRRKPTYAKGIVSIKGANGTVINEGSLLSINNMDYKTMEKVKIEDGMVQVEIESLVSGEIGNANSLSEVSLISDIDGVNHIKLITDITGGYEEESDDSLRERYLNYIQKPPTSGNIYHYIHWAKQIEGVGDVKVIPLWDGDNTVKVVITDSNMETAPSSLVEEVQEHIDPGGTGLGEGEAPIGAFCTVVSAISKDINISVELELNHGFTIKDIRDEVFDNINNYFRKLTFSNNEVSYAKVGAAILFTDGVKDYKDLKLNGYKGNIALESEETAVLREVVINE